MDPRLEMALAQATEGILMHAQEDEKKMQEDIEKLEKLDEDDFEALRQKRKLLLVKKMNKEQMWKQLGHGRYMELSETKEFFEAAKKSERLVCHFYRGTTPRCEIVDAHLSKLAPDHLETRFVKMDAEKHLYLVEKLGIILMPTIVLVRDGHTEHSLRGFDELGGTDDFTTDDMAFVLKNHGVLNFEVDRAEEIMAKSKKGGVNAIGVNSIKSSFAHASLSDDEDDFS